ncbi:MAG: hypothetical protein MJY63_05620 [Paludibacteraceae bacterium]|nr:hypothetical protein [Paludibacteraceae bacterium]
MRNHYSFISTSTLTKGIVACSVLVGSMFGAQASDIFNPTYDGIFIPFTGEYIKGTNFTPTDSVTGDLSLDVKSTFADDSILFSKGNVAYEISDIKGAFGDYIPASDLKAMERYEDTYYNYFMTMANPNGSIVQYKLPAAKYAGYNYGCFMKAYIQPTCDLDADASIRVKTMHGIVDVDWMDAVLIDDVTGDTLGKINDVKSPTDLTEIKFSSLTDVSNLPKTGDTFHVLRLEANYEGLLPADNNGMKYYLVSVDFFRMNCSNVAIDYMSIDPYKAFISLRTVCKGDTTTVYAGGFPLKCTYTWYEKSGDDWEELPFVPGPDGVNRSQPIPVDFIGERDYKVVIFVDSSIVFHSIDFKVIGEDCPNSSVVVCDTLVSKIMYGLVGDKNSATAEELGLKTPSFVYKDGTLIEGVGQRDDNKDVWNDDYNVGSHYVVWDFVVPGVTETNCPQLIVVEKRISTDVDMVDAADVDSIVNVYSVDGALLKKNVKLSEALAALKRGYYIINNQKVFISK